MSHRGSRRLASSMFPASRASQRFFCVVASAPVWSLRCSAMRFSAVVCQQESLPQRALASDGLFRSPGSGAAAHRIDAGLISFRSQRYRRVHSCRPAGRNPAREQGRYDEHGGRRCERKRVGRADPVHQRGQHARSRQSAGKTDRDARQRQAQTDPTTIRHTSDESAPSAMRMPISRVRCATEYAITP